MTCAIMGNMQGAEGEEEVVYYSCTSSRKATKQIAHDGALS